MKRFGLLSILLMLGLTIAGCSIGSTTRQADVNAVKARYATVSGAASESNTLPYLADEVVFEVSLNIFGQHYGDSKTIYPGTFLARFRDLQDNPCSEGSLPLSASTLVSLSLLNNSINWDDAVISVDGTEATVTRTFTATFGDANNVLISATGSTQTFWTKVGTEWKLYKMRHTADINMIGNQ